MAPVSLTKDKKGKIIINSFLGGIAWGVGSVVGATIVVGIIGFFLSQVDIISTLGFFIAQIVDVVNQYGTQ